VAVQKKGGTLDQVKIGAKEGRVILVRLGKPHHETRNPMGDKEIEGTTKKNLLAPQATGTDGQMGQTGGRSIN